MLTNPNSKSKPVIISNVIVKPSYVGVPSQIRALILAAELSADIIHVHAQLAASNNTLS